MSDQYLRRCSLVVGDPSGTGLDLSGLKVRFTVHQSDVQTPNWADIRVYNVSATTALRIQKEFTQVFLQAGYGDDIGLIFSGHIRQVRRGRENATDTYLDLIAQDGDDAYNFSVTNTSLARGWDQKDLHGTLAQSFGTYDVAQGYTPEFGGKAAPRGKACYGMTRDYMRTLADSAGSSWSIRAGQLDVIPLASTLPGPAFVLRSDTGLIGLPQQTVNGINVRCLLNPKIRYGGQVQIDNSSIQQIALNPGFAATNPFVDAKSGKNTGLDSDGFYKVYSVTLIGDTRGQEWYSDLICVGIDATKPLSGPYVNATSSGK